MSHTKTQIKVSIHEASLASNLAIVAITHGIGFTYIADKGKDEYGDNVDEFVFECGKEELITLADKIFNYTTITEDVSHNLSKYIIENGNNV